MTKILLLMEQHQNRRLLAEMLTPRYEVLIPSSDAALQDEFDLGIVDGVVLERLWTQIQTRKEAARPAFLPFLLVTARREVGQATHHLWKTIDELIISPIEKVELQARVEILLRARRLSLESESWFHTILYSIGLAIIAADRRGIVRQMNAEAERVTGWREAEAQGKPLEAVFHMVNTKTHTPLENFVQRVLDAGEVAIGMDDYVLVNARDGVAYPIAGRGTSVRDKNGAVIGMVIACRDHSAEIAAQRTLYESETLFRALFAKADIGIALMDAGSGRLIACNPMLTQILGYTEEQLRTMHLQDTTHPDDLNADLELWEQLRSGQRELYTLEKRYYRRDGQLIWGNLTASLLRDPAGQPWVAVVKLADITARKQTEAKLVEQLDELRRWHQATLGRERRILELKAEVNALLRRLGEPIRYPSAEGDRRDSQNL